MLRSYSSLCLQWARLNADEHSIVPDWIEAVTFATAVATGGRLCLCQA